MKELSRRKFLGLGLGSAAAAALAACSPPSLNPGEQTAVSDYRTRTARNPEVSPTATKSAPTQTVEAIHTAAVATYTSGREGAATGTPVSGTRTVDATRVATGTPVPATVEPSPSVVAARATVAPTRVEASPTATIIAGNAKLEGPKFVEELSHGAWVIKGTDRLAKNPIVAAWLKALKDPQPEKGKHYPNIQGNYPLAEFDVRNGMEYGVANVPFSEHPKGAEFIVPAWHYRLYTGPYVFMGENHLTGDKENGQMLLVINVMNESVTFSDPNQEFRNGFTVPGRFWDGNKLDQGTWALTNHVTANMLNYPTESKMGEVLNAGTPGNAGANCGIPEGCRGVDVNVIVVAGDAVIAQAKTVVSRNGARRPQA